MAVVYEDTLKKNISADKLLPVYLLFGEDGFLKKNYSEKILKKITDADDFFNCQKFTGESDLQEVYDSVMQIPFGADKKYVEICDFDFEKCSKSDFERFCELLEQVPDTSVLVARFDNIEVDAKKSAKFKKLITATEKNGGIAVCLDHKKEAELVKMLCDGAQKRGCKFDSSAARYLVEIAGEDISLLRNELEKLCAYVGNGQITKETVEKISPKTIEASVYNLSRHILDCNLSAALNILDELFFMQIEPMIILSTISSVYVDMMRLFAAKSQGASKRDVDQLYAYKNKAFLLDKAEVNLRKFDKTRLDLSLKTLTDADNSLKSFGAQPRIVLEQLVVRLIYIIVKGEAVDKT